MYPAETGEEKCWRNVPRDALNDRQARLESISEEWRQTLLYGCLQYNTFYEHS